MARGQRTDCRLLFARKDLPPATPDQVAGDWEGRLILVNPSATSLIATPRSPVLSYQSAEGRFRLGYESGAAVTWTEDLPTGMIETRTLKADTLIGKWSVSKLPSALLESLRGYVEPYAHEAVAYYLLKRMKAAIGRP